MRLEKLTSPHEKIRVLTKGVLDWPRECDDGELAVVGETRAAFRREFSLDAKPVSATLFLAGQSPRKLAENMEHKL